MPAITPEALFLSYFRNRCADLSITVSGNVGLNADWCVTSYNLSDCEANVTDGAFYLVDGEDGTWSIIRRYHDPELVRGGDVEPNPHDETVHPDPSYENDHFEVIATTIFLDSEQATAKDIMREADKLLRRAEIAGVKVYRQFSWEVLVTRTTTESARIHVGATSLEDLEEKIPFLEGIEWEADYGRDDIEIAEAIRDGVEFV